jgi:hypothetical protein
MSGLDILDLRDASQAGSIVTLTTLAGRKLVNTTDLAAERALTLHLLTGLRHC